MEQVLFIQLSRLGDCLQSTPLIASWRRRYPDDGIVVLVRAEYASVFERNPDVAETIAFNPPISSLANETIDPIQRLIGVHDWLAILKSRRFRSIINLTHDPFSCWLTTALGPKEIYGLFYDRTCHMRTGDPWGLYTFSLIKFRKANLFNIVDSYVHLSGAASAVNAPVFPLDRECVALADEWLSSCEPGCCIVGFQPGASLAERRWPVENFIKIGRELSSEGVRVLVFGSKAEESLGCQIAQAVPGAISFAGKTTIPQLAALLRRCAVLVTNDTGTMHLGAAVGTRLVALFETSAYFRETGPYGTGHWIIQSPQLLEYGEEADPGLAGVRRILPEEVVWAVRTLLGEVCEKKSKSTAEVSPEIQALHFRSEWKSGHLNFHPALPVPLDSQTVCNYLQKPVWLATLDGFELSAEETAASVIKFLRKYYTVSAEEFDHMIAGAQDQVHKSIVEIKEMKQLLQSCLKTVHRNPKHLFSQDELNELTRLENVILQRESHLSIHGFLGYFEIGLAMVGGNTTREYLEQYLRPAAVLENQLVLFDQLLSACRSLR